MLVRPSAIVCQGQFSGNKAVSHSKATHTRTHARAREHLCQCAQVFECWVTCALLSDTVFIAKLWNCCWHSGEILYSHVLVLQERSAREYYIAYVSNIDLFSQQLGSSSPTYHLWIPSISVSRELETECIETDKLHINNVLALTIAFTTVTRSGIYFLKPIFTPRSVICKCILFPDIVHRLFPLKFQGLCTWNPKNMSFLHICVFQSWERYPFFCLFFWGGRYII